MKLVRYGPQGNEKPGLVGSDGSLRDLSANVADIGPMEVSPAGLAALGRINSATLPVVGGAPRMGTPLAGTRSFIAIGLNYADHAAESNLPIPAEPIVFNKWISCLQGPNDDVVIPRGSQKTDWEVELGVVIGSPASYVTEADALQHVAGYVVVNDVSERAYQTERGGTWDKGKGCATFGPVGPWLVTADEVGNPQNLALWLEVNGRRVQDGNTNTMIFGVAKLVSYCSEFMKLQPGDIITTGTPPGVGMGMKPPVFLKPGDIMRVGVEKLGEQTQLVRAWQEQKS